MESFSGQIDNYLAGFGEQYMGMGFAWMPVWTADHMKALRFTRKVDAETMATNMSAPSKCRAVEHAWMVSPAITKEQEHE